MAKILVFGGLADSLVNFRGALLREMVRRGHDVVGCAAEDCPKVANALAAIGASYIPLHFKRAGLNPFNDLLLLFRLVKLLRQIRPDIVLAYTIKPVIYGSLACRLTGVRRCYSMITGLGYAFMDEGGYRQRLIGKIASLLYRSALDGNIGVFFQNPDDLALFVTRGLLRGQHKALVIHGSGVDTDYFRQAPLPTGSVVFLLIARLLKDKGIAEYAAAATAVKQQYPSTVFRLVGPFDPNPAALGKEQIDAWHRVGVLEYLGETDDVRCHLASCNVYVLPSYREGMPRTVLEAMAMGRPVITTDAPGCREAVTHGDNGFLVPVKDAAALADAMKAFVEHPEWIPRMGQRGREIAENKYEVRNVNAAILRHMRLDV